MKMQDILNRIKERMEPAGFSESSLSVKAGMSRDGIRNWRRRVEAGEEEVGASISNIVGVARALGVSELWLLHGIGPDSENATISVAGRVGAGAEVDLIDAYAKGDGMYFIACPPQIEPHGVVAVEVQGDSMAPVYQPGSVLIYSRDVMGVPAEALNHICVCEDTTGKVWVKHVKPGTEPGLFHLLSTNPAGLNMHDVRLRWAAPVRLHLPQDLVQKVCSS